MLIRRFVLPLSFCVVALMAHSALAQNVLLPADNSSNSGGGSSLFSSPSTQQDSNGGIFSAPRQGSTPQQNVVTPQTQTNIPQPPAVQPVPPNERDEYAYRTFGIEIPKASLVNKDPYANFSPEEIAIARKGFAAMEASNPQMAARNPFRQIDAMNNARKAQDALVARAKAACDVQSFNVMVSPQSFMQSPEAVDGLNKNGVALIGNLIQDMCSDRDMRTKMANSVPMLTIVQRARTPMSVDSNQGIITISADFASTDQPQMQVVRSAFAKAINDNDALIQGGQ